MENHDERRSGEGFRKIGALLPQVSTMPENGASISAPKSSSSGTTTSPRGRPLPTSVPPGERGVAMRSSSPPSDLQVDLNLLASWPQRFVQWLENHEHRVPGDAGPLLVAYKLPPVDTVHHEKLRAIVADLDAAMAPAPEDMVIMMLARVRKSTTARNEDRDDLDFSNEIYLEELSEFPEDVVEAACRYWCHHEKWWPSVMELRDQCRRRVRWRSVTRDALARALVL